MDHPQKFLLAGTPRLRLAESLAVQSPGVLVSHPAPCPAVNPPFIRYLTRLDDLSMIYRFKLSLINNLSRLEGVAADSNHSRFGDSS